MKQNLSLIFVCHYFPPEDNVGVRRVSFWANYYAAKGFVVTVITTKKSHSERLYQHIDRIVKVIEFSTFSANFVSDLDYNHSEYSSEEDSSSQPSLIVNALIKFKRKVINPVFGQLVDYRIIPVFGFIFKSRLGMYDSLFNSIQNKNCVVISTAPPWPVHILGRFISNKLGVPFYADYRDPFSNHHMFSSVFSSIEEYIDRYICEGAKGVFTVSDSWQKYYKKFNQKTHLLRNGFDVDMFDFSVSNQKLEIDFTSRIFNLNYFGSIEHPSRIPYELLSFLEKTNLNITVHFYGSCSLIEELMAQNHNLTSKIILHGILAYDEAVNEMKQSQINLVSEAVEEDTLSNRGLIPTKVYEYLACMRPILAVVNKNSDMADILTKSGLLIHNINESIDFDYIFSDENIANLSLEPNTTYIKSLSRQHVSDTLLEIIGGGDVKN